MILHGDSLMRASGQEQAGVAELRLVLLLAGLALLYCWAGAGSRPMRTSVVPPPPPSHRGVTAWPAVESAVNSATVTVLSSADSSEAVSVMLRHQRRQSVLVLATLLAIALSIGMKLLVLRRR